MLLSPPILFPIHFPTALLMPAVLCGELADFKRIRMRACGGRGGTVPPDQRWSCGDKLLILIGPVTWGRAPPPGGAIPPCRETAMRAAKEVTPRAFTRMELGVASATSHGRQRRPLLSRLRPPARCSAGGSQICRILAGITRKSTIFRKLRSHALEQKLLKNC